MPNFQFFPFLLAVIYAGVRMSMPIVFATTGEIVCERAGLLNLSLEGEMMAGAFFAFMITYYTDNLLLGVLAGAAAGMILALIFAVACVSFQADQTIAGITINMIAMGMTSFWYKAVFGVTVNPPTIRSIPALQIEKLSDIPVVGQLLFNHNVLVYVAIVAVIFISIFLFKTTFGLKLRSVGEYPLAASTMGINVVRMRYIAALICGALAGIGGAYLTMSILGRFVVGGTTNGRGYIALAITIFGRWNPIYGFLAAIFFGILEGLQLRLQALGIAVPYQFLLMLPYLFTAIIMIISVGRTQPPAALTKIYKKEML